MEIKNRNTIIMESIDALVRKAFIEIPKMPDSTKAIERIYIAELYTIDGVDHIFSFYCIPPHEYGDDGLNKMMFGCELCIPSRGSAFSHPLMYESKDDVIKNLYKGETKDKIFKKFLFLFEGFDKYCSD